MLTGSKRKLYTLHQSSELSPLSPEKKSGGMEHLDLSSNSNSVEMFDVLRDHGTLEAIEIEGSSLRDLKYKLSLAEIESKQLLTKIKFVEQKLQKSEEHNHDLIQKLGAVEVENKQLRYRMSSSETQFKEIEEEAQVLAAKHDELVEQYTALQETFKAQEVDIINLKQTSAHLCDLLAQNSDYERLIEELKKMQSQLEKGSWEDLEVYEAISQQISIVVNSITQTMELMRKIKELENQLTKTERQLEEVERTSAQTIKIKDRSIEQYQQFQLRVLKEKDDLLQQLHMRNIDVLREIDRRQINMPRQVQVIEYPQVEVPRKPSHFSARTSFRSTAWEKGRLKDELEQIDSEITSLQSQLMREMMNSG